MNWIGTSGFQYPEWKGSFYPATISTVKMLPFYAEHFSTTEINYSFYRIPTAKTLANWAAETPKNFRFSLKAPQEITHVRKLRDCADGLGRFSEVLANLYEKRGPILFQLPPFFKKDLPLLKDFLGALPRNLKCAFEFRHTSWFDDETFAALKSHNAALCIAESEKLAAPIIFTADFGYFRLRREDYTSPDIARWAKIISGQQAREDSYIYFKHEEAGVGPKFAKELISTIAAG
jgi:uncharacterized protein YecE (DUF72 family)